MRHLLLGLATTCLAACASGGGAGTFSPGGNHFGDDGGTSMNPNGAADRFAGSWSYRAGSTNTINCNGSIKQSAITGSDSIVKLSASRVALVTSTGNCQVGFGVNGSSATLLGQPTCSSMQVVNGQTVTVTAMFTSGALATSDGQNLTMQLQSTVVTQGNGTTVTCSSNAVATLTRTAKK